MDTWMLVPGWIRGETKPEDSGVSLNTVIDHIDHVCQLAGNCRHAALGTDLDGGFGKEQSPVDVDTIADLQKMPELLRARIQGGGRVGDSVWKLGAILPRSVEAVRR